MSDSPREPVANRTVQMDPAQIASAVAQVRTGEGAEKRYVLGETLGAGSGGEVLAAEDRALGRPVAVKRMHPGMEALSEQFIAEARLTARLEHHGVLPIHDLGMDADGRPYFVMRRFHGRDLSSETGGVTPGDSAALNRLVSLMIRVGETLAYAHRQEVVHRDIKPENILVGAFGEVVVIDWGAASASGTQHGGVVGTPLYMSPEQARGEPADPRSDIYAFGATLFHLLLGRPACATASEHFWEAKRAGRIVPPDAFEAERVPRALVAIALRAMAPQPADRYPDASALVADLVAWQGGQAVSALPDPPWLRLWRWMRRHRQALAIAGAGGALAGVFLVMFLHERALAAADWRQVLREDFTAQRLGEPWQARRIPGYTTVEEVALDVSGWRIINGVLEGKDHERRVINLYRPVPQPGALRAQWTVTPIEGNQNINCFIGGPNRQMAYTIHLGGWGRPEFVALTRGRNDILDSTTMAQPLMLGRSYRCELELEGGRIHFALDGRTLIECRDPVPLLNAERHGMGFECAGGVLRIDDLELWAKPLPRRISPLAAGDALAGAGLHRQAVEEYLGYAATWPTDADAPTAQLRAAQALHRAGETAQAQALLARLSEDANPSVATRARVQRVLILPRDASVDHARLDDLVAALAGREVDPGEARRVFIAAVEAGWPQNVGRGPVDQAVAAIAKMRRWATILRIPPGDLWVFRRIADNLNGVGRYDLVRELCPDAVAESATAALASGRFPEVAASAAAPLHLRLLAVVQSGSAEPTGIAATDAFVLRCLRSVDGVPDVAMMMSQDHLHAFELALRDGADTTLAAYPNQREAVAAAMLRRGDAHTARMLATPGSAPYRRASLALGILDEQSRPSGLRADARIEMDLAHLRRLAAVLEGHPLPAMPSEPSFGWSPQGLDWFPQHFGHFVLPTLLAQHVDGSDPRPAWEALAREQAGRMGGRIDARWNYLLGRSGIDEVLAQPFQGFDHPRREAALLQAIRAVVERAPDAVARCEAVLQTARHEDVVVRAWARWQAGRPDPLRP